MKIIIVGAGIAGLSTYLHLRKFLPSFDSHTVLIYESHQPRSTALSTTEQLANLDDLSSSTAIVGGGLGLAPNGVRILRNLDPKLCEAAKARGFVCENFAFKTARGHYLAKQSTSDRKDPPEHSLSISRHALWLSLQEVIGEDKIQYKKVANVDLSGAKPAVKFTDGGEEDADLVIGADGVRSTVKKAIFGQDNEDKYAPQYEGICGVGAFMDMEIPQELADDKSMVFTFGPTGFFGYAPAEDPSKRNLLWWSNWESPSVPDRKSIDVADIQRQLRERHSDWADPLIKDIISTAKVDSIYPIWTTPNLPHWGLRGTVLIGDAAHAIQPTTGQGSSQVLEDSITFALLLSHYVNVTEQKDATSIAEAVRLSAKGLYDIREPRVARIKAVGRRMDKSKRSVNLVMEYMMYGFMWLMMNVPMFGKLVLGDIQRDTHIWVAEDQVEAYFQKRGS